MVNPIRMKYLVHSDTFSLGNLQINYVGSCSWTHVVALCPKMVFHGPWRSVFLRHVMDDWSQSIGLVSLRGDPKRDLLVGGTSEPSEESVALLNGPISMILAHFGVCLPVMSKFKAASVAQKNVFSAWFGSYDVFNLSCKPAHQSRQHSFLQQNFMVCLTSLLCKRMWVPGQTTRVHVSVHIVYTQSVSGARHLTAPRPLAQLLISYMYMCFRKMCAHFQLCARASVPPKEWDSSSIEKCLERNLPRPSCSSWPQLPGRSSKPPCCCYR